MFNKDQLTWLEFKQLIHSKKIHCRFREYPERYDLDGIEKSVQYFCIVYKDNNSEQVDFETNFKNTSINLTPSTDSIFINTYADSIISNNTTVDTYYTITNGKTLIIQKFLAAAQSGINGNEIELYYDPLGQTPIPPNKGANWSLLSLVIIPDSGGNYNEELVQVALVGDGIHRVVIRRTRLGGGNARILGRIIGHEQ